jgi:hypothetical protein
MKQACWFQSSAGPKAGCNYYTDMLTAHVEAFQSSAGPKAGCNRHCPLACETDLISESAQTWPRTQPGASFFSTGQLSCNGFRSQTTPRTSRVARHHYRSAQQLREAARYAGFFRLKAPRGCEGRVGQGDGQIISGRRRSRYRSRPWTSTTSSRRAWRV